MRLSRKSDYALRAVRYLANLPTGKLGSINTVSEAESIPREFLAKILKDLTMGGILVSYQGVTGGYRLARPPREVTFLDVIEVINGPIHLSLYTEEKRSSAKPHDEYDMCNFWENLEQQFKKALGKQHFAKYRRKARK